MKKIKLTQGKYALVDDADYVLVSKHKWCAHKQKAGFYAYNSSLSNPSGAKGLSMHRFLVGIAGLEVDHKNHNGLDNRRKNLRPCTESQNRMNRRLGKAFPGVYRVKRLLKKRWVAKVGLNKKSIFIGYFENRKQAITDYRDAVKKFHGEFGRIKK